MAPTPERNVRIWHVPHFLSRVMLHNFKIDFLCILYIDFILKYDIINNVRR